MKTKMILPLVSAALIAVLLLNGCAADKPPVELDPKNPITITVWHYYNGAIMNAFVAMVDHFNETVGLEKGIIVESSGHGNVTDLEKAVMASAKKEIGSLDMPNIFASYADTAYEAEKLNLLANLDEYFDQTEQNTYRESYIEEGKIGLHGELRIFPVAKSTEVLMINETDWLPFAEAHGLTYDALSTMEGLAEVAEQYYHWTDAQTPETPHDGKAFFGRDSMANLFIIATKEFGVEIFHVENGNATINVVPEVMRKIWDYYYVPYISGYYYAYGKFRSDDAKVGDIVSFVASTSSAAYFPTEVSVGGEVYPITAKVLPAPLFDGGRKVMVQQGAGMVVTQGTPQEEYASVLFLKWFTDTENNIAFSSLSGYLPVKEEAIHYETIIAKMQERQISLDTLTDETLKVAINSIRQSEMYTNKAFNGGTAARAVLDHSLQDLAVVNREAVQQLIVTGTPREQAIAQFNTDECFNEWLADITQKLNATLQ